MDRTNGRDRMGEGREEKEWFGSIFRALLPLTGDELRGAEGLAR